MSYKVLVVEDDDVIRLGIVELLKSLKCDVKEAADGQAAIEYLQDYSFHMVITDLVMENGFGGEEIIDFMNQQEYEAVKLVISGVIDIKKKIELYEMGVVDYITKPFDYMLVKYKIKSFMCYEEKVHHKNDLMLNYEDKKVIILDDEFVLTRKEYELFELFISFPLHVFSKYDLIMEVWYENMNMSEKVVETNICNIRKKIGKKYENCIKTVKESGYYYDPEEIKKLKEEEIINSNH